MKCELCGNEMDKIEFLVIQGAPKVCSSCVQKYEQCKKGLISIDNLITPSTSRQVVTALENSLNRKAKADSLSYNENAESEGEESTIGKAIKITSIIVLVLSVIGSLVMMLNSGFAVGFAVLLVSVLICLLSYGIGEICSLLTDIKNKL